MSRATASSPSISFLAGVSDPFPASWLPRRGVPPVDPSSRTIPNTVARSAGEGRKSTIASSTGCTPMFLAAAPHNTGTTSPLSTCLLRAARIWSAGSAMCASASSPADSSASSNTSSSPARVSTSAWRARDASAKSASEDESGVCWTTSPARPLNRIASIRMMSITPPIPASSE